jgi:sugar lactone lactonase YvrE
MLLRLQGLARDRLLLVPMLHQKRKTVNRRLVLIAVALAAAWLPNKAHCAPGDLYETDLASGTIFKFAPDGTQSSFASGLIAPVGLAFDGKGNTFIGDAGGGAVVRVAPDGTQTTFANIPEGPTGLAVDNSGNLFVAVFNKGAVLKFTPNAAQSTFVSGLTNATGLAFDKDGNLFAADLGGGVIYKITGPGVKSPFASGLSGPGGLAFDRSGNLFAADNVSGMIYKFTPDGTMSAFASGVPGAAGVAFDGGGNLFVASNADGTIYKFTPDGSKSTFASGLAGSTFLAFEPVPQKLLNVSARSFVQGGDNVLIGGFIVGGSSLLNNLVVIRAIGPSLSQAGVANPLPDPTLEVRDASGAIIASNDNWQNTQKAQIMASGVAPADTHESVILTQLPAGEYSAIVRSADDTPGIALVEIYNAP